MNPQSLNILVLTASWHPPVGGGVKANARILVKEIATRHAVTVFVMNWNRKSCLETIDDDGIPVIERRVRSPISEDRAFRTLIGWLIDLPAFLRQFRRICRDRRIDVIHIHQVNGYWLNVALAKVTGIPEYTVGLHGGEVRGYAKSGFLSRQCFKFIVNNAAAVTAVSNELAAKTSKLFPALTNVVVIRNGIRETRMGEDEADPLNVSKGMETPKLFFLSVGSLLHVKGHDVAIRGWRHVLKVRPDCHLLIVGEGERRTHLERLISECECEGRVHLVGAQTPATVQRLMSRACGLVHPSRYESLGIVLLEAGVAGCPVVAMRVGGIPEVIEDEISGLLVDPENEVDLSKAVLRVLTDTKFATAMARNLAKRVHSEFSAGAMAERYISLFRKVVARRNSRRSS